MYSMVFYSIPIFIEWTGDRTFKLMPTVGDKSTWCSSNLCALLSTIIPYLVLVVDMGPTFQ